MRLHRTIAISIRCRRVHSLTVLPAVANPHGQRAHFAYWTCLHHSYTRCKHSSCSTRHVTFSFVVSSSLFYHVQSIMFKLYHFDALSYQLINQCHAKNHSLVSNPTNTALRQANGAKIKLANERNGASEASSGSVTMSGHQPPTPFSHDGLIKTVNRCAIGSPGPTEGVDYIVMKATTATKRNKAYNEDSMSLRGGSWLLQIQ